MTWTRRISLFTLSFAAIALAFASTPTAMTFLVQNGPGTCKWYHPDGAALERRCSNPNSESCGVGKVCRQVYGSGWRDCFCLDVDVTQGAEPGGSCQADLRWKVQFKVKKQQQQGYITMNTVTGAGGFMDYFDTQAILPSGHLASFMRFDESVGQMHAYAVFDRVSPANPPQVNGQNASEVNVILTDFGATFDPGMALGYLTGTTEVTLNPGQTVFATFNEQEGLLMARDYAECTVTNFLYPEGETMFLELSAIEVDGDWTACAKAEMPVELQASHDYDPITGVLTLKTERAYPGAALEFFLAKAEIGDVDHNRKVDSLDLQFVLDRFGICSTTPCLGDLDLDGKVDDEDAALVSSSIGQSDLGQTPIGNCNVPISMKDAAQFTVSADSSGVAVAQIPIAGIELSAWHFQSADPSNCTISNMTKFIVD